MFRLAIRSSLRASVLAPSARLAGVRLGPISAPFRLVASSLTRQSSTSTGELSKAEIEGRIVDLLRGFEKIKDLTTLSPTADFHKDLGLDSLDTVEVVMAIEEEFSIEIPDKQADAIRSVNQAADYIASQPDAH